MTIILLSFGIPAALLIGYSLGKLGANAAIEHERSLVVNLQAQNDCLQTKMLAILEKQLDGGARDAEKGKK